MDDHLFPATANEDRQNTRRLPVYLLLDTSGSMQQNEAIGAVQRGIEQLKRVLLNVPEAVQTVHIKVITFSSTITESPMTPLLNFDPPQLSASGATALGAALRQLNEDAQFGHDLIRNSSQQKGDWLPIVFILTDGEPTDPPGEFSLAANMILQRMRRREMNVFAIACGPATAPSTLHQISDNVLAMNAMTDEQFRALFEWISQSVAARSRAVSRPRGEETPGPTEMPPPQPGLVIV